MTFLGTLAWSVLAVIFLPYMLHHILLGFCKGRDLKRRYNAEWALVTGASSGAQIDLQRICSGFKPETVSEMHPLKFLPVCNSAPDKSVPIDFGLCCGAQASASPLRSGWRGRGST
jgi:hypothetical protein